VVISLIFIFNRDQFHLSDILILILNDIFFGAFVSLRTHNTYNEAKENIYVNFGKNRLLEFSIYYILLRFGTDLIFPISETHWLVAIIS